MADGVGITTGADATVLTDDTGAGGHAQIIKLAIATNGSPTLIPADADGLLVNLGANNDVTVTGTVTANLAAGTNNIGDVDVLTVPAPLNVTGTGTEASALRVTIATDSTGVLSIDDNGASITIDGTVTVGAITAGDNNIGNVDIVTVPAPLSTTGGGTEATALRVTLANDSTGVVSVDDNGGSITIDGTVTVGSISAGDNNIGNVDIVTMPAVTNAGTFAVQVDGAALTALQLIDDPVATLGTTTYTEAASKGMIVGAVRRDADTTLVDTTNEVAPLIVDARGLLKVEAFSGETLPVSLASTTVTGTVAVTQSGTWDEVGINDSGNSITVDAPVGTPVFVRLSDGSAAIATLPVSLASVPSHAVTNAGTFATQVDGAALTALQLIDDPVFADDAAFTVGTSKVNMTGVLAVAHGSTPDTADALDAGAMLANRHRIPFMLGGHPNLQSAEYFTSGAITDDNILPAISAGTIYVITGITVTCSAANATSPSVRIGFGATTLTAQGATNADAVTKILLSHPGIPAGSGVVKGHAGGIVGIGGDGEELRITCTTPTTSMIVQVDYFTITS